MSYHPHNPDNDGACHAPDCEEQARTKGYCSAHYGRMKRHGTTEAYTRKNIDQTCTANDCEAPARSLGLCPKHYNRLNRTGTTEAQDRSNNGKTCTVDDCDTPARTRGLCPKHYSRYKRTRATNRPPIMAETTCTAQEGCDRPASYKHLCTKHGARAARHGTTNLVPRTPYTKCANDRCRNKATENGQCKPCNETEAKAKRYAPQTSPQCITKNCLQPATTKNYCDRHGAMQERIHQRQRNDQKRQTAIHQIENRSPNQHHPATYNMANHLEHLALGISHPTLQPTPAPWLTATWSLDHYTSTGAGPIPLTRENIALLIQIATEDLNELCRRRKALPHTIGWKIAKGPAPVLAATFQIQANAHHIDGVRAAYRQTFPGGRKAA